MKVCEYNDIICPVCKSDKNLKETDTTLVGMLPYHKIICLWCNTIVFVPCED